MTSWSQGNSFIATLGLPFTAMIHMQEKTYLNIASQENVY
jgi:hypothetical protein